MTLHINSVQHLEREFDYGQLATYIPRGDAHDYDRALGAYIKWFEEEYETVDPNSDDP